MASQKALNALDVKEARRLMLDQLCAISGWETVPIRAALERILYHDVVAPFDVPAHTNSAMDGYAVRHADLSDARETRLSVIDTAFAGQAYAGHVEAGQAVRIMTGAVMPSGADTVVVQECVRSDGDGDGVVIPPGQSAGQNVRYAGEDLARGKPALTAGKRLGPAEIGLLASLGIGEVCVRRRLRVAFFSTGDEIASLGRPLAPGQVYDSNRYTLFGLLTRLGVELFDMGVVRDDPQALETALREASCQADAILTSGGVSVGDADYIRELTARLGDVRFWKLNIKPGRPMAFGRVGNAWLFGLPGNPVAVMVTFQQIVVDALARLMGCDPLPERPLFKVRCVSPLAKSAGRREFVRGILFNEAGEWRVRAVDNQGSGVLSSMANANCYVVLAESGGDVAAGDWVDVQPFSGIV